MHKLRLYFSQQNSVERIIYDMHKLRLYFSQQNSVERIIYDMHKLLYDVD